MLLLFVLHCVSLMAIPYLCLVYSTYGKNLRWAKETPCCTLFVYTTISRRPGITCWYSTVPISLGCGGLYHRYSPSSYLYLGHKAALLLGEAVEECAI